MLNLKQKQQEYREISYLGASQFVLFAFKYVCGYGYVHDTSTPHATCAVQWLTCFWHRSWRSVQMSRCHLCDSFYPKQKVL
jgi:hypothetical protein